MPPAAPSLSVILDELRTAVLLVDAANRVCWANPAAEELLQASAARLEGAPLEDCVAGFDSLQSCVVRVREEGRAMTERDMALNVVAGGPQHVDCDVTPLASIGLVMVEMHRLEPFQGPYRDALSAEQGEAARLLLRGLAHEIKNPLGGLRGAAQLLEQEIDESLREYTRVIIGEADRLKGLLDRMLAPQRPLELERLNVHEVTERVFRLMQAEAPASVEVVRDYDPSIPEFAGDRSMLIQALLNIGRNAIQALVENPPLARSQLAAQARAAASGTGPAQGNVHAGDCGGSSPRVVLRTRVVHQPTIGQARSALAVRVDVEDNGPGVPEALAGRLFYPMVTGRSEGTGLGLSISQMLVAQHGGVVDHVREGARTIFSMLLPVDAQVATVSASWPADSGHAFTTGASS